MTGPYGDYYLSQTITGQAIDSPCVDTGSDLAENICFETADGTICMDQLTTSTNHISDSGQVDMGYHYKAVFSCSAICLTPVVHPGEQVQFHLTVENMTDENQTARAVSSIYHCNGSFLKDDIYYNYVPFNSFQFREETRVLDVPVSLPPVVKNCDLRYEIVVEDRITGHLLCSSSCYFQIQDVKSAQKRGD